jgi:hypothetical protein
LKLHVRRILLSAAGISALALAGVCSGAHAARLTPAYRPSGSTPRAVNASKPASNPQLNVYQRERLETLIAPGAIRSTAAEADDTLRVLAFQVQFQDSLMGGQPGSNRSALRRGDPGPTRRRRWRLDPNRADRSAPLGGF